MCSSRRDDNRVEWKEAEIGLKLLLFERHSIVCSKGRTKFPAHVELEQKLDYDF